MKPPTLSTLFALASSAYAAAVPSHLQDVLADPAILKVRVPGHNRAYYTQVEAKDQLFEVRELVIYPDPPAPYISPLFCRRPVFICLSSLPHGPYRANPIPLTNLPPLTFPPQKLAHLRLPRRLDLLTPSRRPRKRHYQHLRRMPYTLRWRRGQTQS